MEVVTSFLTSTEHQILFILPLVVMTIATLALKPVLPPEKIARKTGRLAAYSDMHREAYIGAVIASVITIGAFMLRGGPEPFVLVWKPLLSTVMVLPFGYGVALAIASVTGMTRRA